MRINEIIAKIEICDDKCTPMVVAEQKVNLLTSFVHTHSNKYSFLQAKVCRSRTELSIQ